jgi:hypothetical protein
MNYYFLSNFYSNNKSHLINFDPGRVPGFVEPFSCCFAEGNSVYSIYQNITPEKDQVFSYWLNKLVN